MLVEFSLFPIGKGESVGRYVARSLDIVHRSGLPYELHSMGTILEGEWDEVFAVIRRCYARMKKDCPRIAMTLKLDHRRGARGRLAAKVSSVERRLSRRLGRKRRGA